MIRHIVFFSARDPAQADEIREGLQALATIPGSSVFEVCQNTKVDPMGNEIDLVVYAEFPDKEALFAYKAHPVYAATTAKVRPLRDMRFSADIASAETQEAAPPQTQNGGPKPAALPEMPGAYQRS